MLSRSDNQQELREKIIRDALSQNMERISFYALNDVIKAYQDKQGWTLDVFIELINSSDKDVASVSYDELCNASGLKLGRDSYLWIEWLNRLRQSLPSLMKSNVAAFEASVISDDHYVRLFSLKQLSQREDVDMEPLLEKALSDEDENVRGFAESELKKLKPQEEKK